LSLGAEYRAGPFHWENHAMAKFKFFVLEGDEITELTRPVTGSGGFENVLRRFQKQFNPATKTIKLTDDDLGEIPHVAFDYKDGGFEKRLLRIFSRVLGPKLGRDE
jgi:hypothetical protein